MRLLPPAVVLIIAVGLTACAPPQPAPPPPTPSAVTAPTPAPEVIGPVPAFGGDCTNVLSSEQVESILGPGYSEAATPVSGDISLLGDIDCEWVRSGATGYSEPGVDTGLPEGMDTIAVVALPADVVKMDLSEPRCDPKYDATMCRMSRIVDGVWLMARAGWHLSSPPVEQLDAALTAAAANLASFPPPVAARSDSDWWELPACDDIAVRIGLSAFLGEGFHSGFWEGSLQPEDQLRDDAGMLRLCPWSTEGASAGPDQEFHIVTLHIMPGGALRWDALLARADATEISVAGAQAAIRVGDEVFATDGVNTLGVVTGDAHPDDSALAVALAERALAALAT